MTTTAAMGAVAVLGFAASLLLFKVKSRWCQRCGAALNCPRLWQPPLPSVPGQQPLGRVVTRQVTRKQPNTRASVYLPAAVLDQLRAAQWVLDAHVTSSVTGRCRACDAPGPCPASEHAVASFRCYGRLPRCTPGATRPDLINARCVTVSETAGRTAINPTRRGRP